MEIVPVSAGIASRDWDEQSLDLRGAVTQVRDAGTDGFTSAVAGTARAFLSSWRQHVQGLADDAEGHADGLRVTIDDWLKTDGRSADVLLQLQLQLYRTEVR